MAQQRWWQRPGDGIVFAMSDPDHIARMLREGWREVEHPAIAPAPVDPPTPAPPETPAQIQARQEQNDAARAAFRGTAPGTNGNTTAKRSPRAKQIRPAGTPPAPPMANP